MTEFAVNGIVIVPLIIGLVEVAKKLGLSDKLCPVLALALGTVVGVFCTTEISLQSRLVTGVALGLSSSGLYSGAKNTIEAFSKGGK